MYVYLASEPRNFDCSKLKCVEGRVTEVGSTRFYLVQRPSIEVSFILFSHLCLHPLSVLTGDDARNQRHAGEGFQRARHLVG